MANRPIIEQRIADLQQDKRQCVQDIQDLSAQLTDTDSSKAESDRLFAEQRIAERDLDREKKTQASLSDRVARLSEAAAQAQQTAEETLEKARRHSPGAEDRFRENTRQPQSLAVLLKEEKAKYEEAQKLHGLDFTKVRADYLKAKASVDRATRYLRELAEFLSRAEEAIAVRKEKLQQIQH